MEWKVYYRTRMPKRIFDTHDEEWIAAYTREHPSCLGAVVSVDLFSHKRQVYWKYAKSGTFSTVQCVQDCDFNCE